MATRSSRKAAGRAKGLQKDIVHVRDLTPDPSNARRHTPRNIGLIGDGWQKFGAARSIVVDEAGVVLAGNGVVEAAAERGITRVRVIDTDGSELIAVRRRNLTVRGSARSRKILVAGEDLDLTYDLVSENVEHRLTLLLGVAADVEPTYAVPRGGGTDTFPAKLSHRFTDAAVLLLIVVCLKDGFGLFRGHIAL